MAHSEETKSRKRKPYSEEAKRKFSEAHKGNKYPNISKAKKGVKLSDECKKKMSEKHKTIDHQKWIESGQKAITGTTWMNNGNVNKRVHPAYIDYYIKLGFEFGVLRYV